MKENSSKKQKNELPSTSPQQVKPTVVGIGASAGGLAALRRFFELIPSDSGLAFVVVVHLSPEHKSFLPDLLQASVRFPVQQVTETTLLEANHVYVIPPNANLSAIDTHLRLSKLEELRRERAPIDHFFRTLAGTHDGHSIGVILTGTGSDGTLGLKEIKEKGGLILVQDPNDAEFDGMPQSAIATGLVDRVLPIDEIPEALLRLVQVKPQIAFTRNGKQRAQPEQVLLSKVLAILKARTERDFSRYKSATILRRIARRMQLNYIEDSAHYLERLREHPEEARALAEDLLITVTSFFRDQDVFSNLEKEVIPRLFEGKGVNDSLRVWSVGCATGEEAYSVAMLLLEEADRRNAPPKIQIFASDLHRRSLEGAREGLYSGDIEADVSAERLSRFFQKENGGYRVCKEVRDTVVFAPHNLLADPPFSRLNLITCRNLLIYLDRSVQRDVIDLFHYALCPDGYLLLGSAETVDAPELFRAEDKKRCLYRKRNVPAPEPRLPVFPLASLRAIEKPSVKTENTRGAVAYHSLHQDLLERYAPPSILVGPDDKLAHLSEHAGRYLLHPGGEVTLSAARLVRDELRLELQVLLRSAREKKEWMDSKPIAVRLNGHTAPVVMRLRPAQDAEHDGFVLVIFEELRPQPEAINTLQVQNGGAHVSVEQDGRRSTELEAELSAAHQRLQATVEEYETSREEMKASNEEMQSTNEELRSTLEELETSKEELQSINEELQTVNQENRHKVEELSQLSGDLQNFLSATGIATLFLDRELRILRFTPRVADLFNTRVTDRGRPISDLTHRLGYAQLCDDAQSVLNLLVPVEREIQDNEKRWYLTRVLPYRSPEDRIEGVVITFTDITTQKLAEAVLRESEDRQAFLLKLSDALRPLSDPLRVQEVASRMLGEHLKADRVAFAEIVGDEMVVFRDYARNVPSMVGRYPKNAFGEVVVGAFSRSGMYLAENLPEALDRSDAQKAALRAIQCAAYLGSTLFKEGRLAAAFALHQATPRTWTKSEISLVEEVAGRIWEAVQRARAETALRESEEKYRTLFESIDEGFCVVDLIYGETGTTTNYRFLEVNPVFERQTGLKNAAGKLGSELDPNPEPYWLQGYDNVARTGEPLRRENYHEISGRWYSVYASRVGGAGSHKVALIFDDITERKQINAALRESEERQALLLKLSDTLQTITDPDNIQQAAMRLLGEHLGLSRAYYFDMEHDGDGWVHIIDSEYRRDPGQPSMIGRHPLKNFGSRMFDDLPKGSVVNVPDVHSLAALAPNELESYRTLGVAAFINVPLLRYGEYTVGITAHSTTPRIWTPAEIALIREAAARTWDMIERARAERAMRESEEKFRTLANTALALIWQNDADGENLFTNQYFLDYTGMSAEEMQGTGWHTLIHPDDAPAYIADYLAAVRDRRPWYSRNRVRRHDGEWHSFDSYAQPLLGREGKYLGHVGVSVDVTESIQAAESLAQSEHRLRTALEGIPQLVWRSKDSGNWTWASPQWMLFTGQSQEESVGQGWLNALHEDDREPAREAWATAISKGLLDVEYRVRRASDGAYVWHRTRAVPVRAPNREVLEWLGTSTDIEQLKQTEAARREAEENFRLFVENVQEYALVQTDPEGLITNWNPGAERLFGYAPEQILGQNFSFLLTEEDQKEGVFFNELTLVTGGIRNEDARWFVRKDGSRFWARWITEPMRDETGQFRGLAKIMRDETEREQAEAFTRHSLAEKEQLLKEVHHRVKNNLQVIVSLLNMQAFQIRDEYVMALFQEARNRVLAISSIHELLYRADSFAHIVLTDYARQLAPGLVHFYGLEQRIQVEVLGDGATLELERAVPYGILLNELVSNACKHAFPTPRTGTITIGVKREGDNTLLTVADNGGGLPAGFDYQKASSLGLKLVHGLARQLRGVMEIDSDSGTVVKIRFPAARTGREE